MSDYVLESIVRALAEADTVVGETVGEESYYECLFCTGSTHRYEEHDPDCVWRRAREWVDANPPRITPGFKL